MTLTLQNRLADFLKPFCRGQVAADVRIGLGYTAVRLADGHAGVAWTPRSDSTSCTHFQGAGTLAGRPAAELLAMLADGNSGLARAVGLATANALLAAVPRPDASREEIVSLLKVSPEDRVAMVGYFGPVISRLRTIGCTLDIIELKARHDETLTPEQGKKALASCSVAIITGTSLINGTCDDLLATLVNPRAAVLLGPSSPLCPEVFTGTKLTHLAGSRVRDAEALLRIVSEGGGTMLMKKHLDFETVTVGR